MGWEGARGLAGSPLQFAGLGSHAWDQEGGRQGWPCHSPIPARLAWPSARAACAVLWRAHLSRDLVGVLGSLATGSCSVSLAHPTWPSWTIPLGPQMGEAVLVTMQACALWTLHGCLGWGCPHCAAICCPRVWTTPAPSSSTLPAPMCAQLGDGARPQLLGCTVCAGVHPVPPRAPRGSSQQAWEEVGSQVSLNGGDAVPTCPASE